MILRVYQIRLRRRWTIRGIRTNRLQHFADRYGRGGLEAIFRIWYRLRGLPLHRPLPELSESDIARARADLLDVNQQEREDSQAAAAQAMKHVVAVGRGRSTDDQ
jgi:hypothetical protein